MHPHRILVYKIGRPSKARKSDMTLRLETQEMKHEGQQRCACMQRHIAVNPACWGNIRIFADSSSGRLPCCGVLALSLSTGCGTPTAMRASAQKLHAGTPGSIVRSPTPECVCVHGLIEAGAQRCGIHATHRGRHSVTASQLYIP